MIVREEETLRKTAVLQIVCEELFIRSIGSVFNALLFCFGQRKRENLNLDVSSGKIGCQFAGKQLGIGAGQVNITIENPAEGISPELLFGTAINDAARALNLDRSGETYTTTISVQLIYELVRMRSKKIRGIVTIYDVMRLLAEM